MNRIVEAMHRLRDAGNTLVVVEHDPAVMLAADRLIDMGPGPGERGGQIVFDGTPDAARNADTLTGAYLGARKHVGIGLRRFVNDATPKLILQGVTEHNLQNIEVSFPAAAADRGHRRQRLRQEHPGAGRAGARAAAPLRQAHRRRGCTHRAVGHGLAGRRGVRRPEPHRQDGTQQPGQLRGARSTRSASCSPRRRLAVERSYGAGMFSFNAGDGRCPPAAARASSMWRCKFLSDVVPALPRLRRQALPRRIAGGQADPWAPMR